MSEMVDAMVTGVDYHVHLYTIIRERIKTTANTCVYAYLGRDTHETQGRSLDQISEILT